MRTPLKFGWRRLAALGLSILSALAHGPALLAVSDWAGWAVLTRDGAFPIADFALLAGGWSAAALSMIVGARRAGSKARALDLLAAPAYWALQSVAA